jgi:hypothetical protein
MVETVVTCLRSRGDVTEMGFLGFLNTLFSRRGFLVAIYILIGVFLNTAAPHLPTSPSSASTLHSWGQYVISVLFWPLGLWHPTFTLGKWRP